MKELELSYMRCDSEKMFRLRWISEARMCRNKFEWLGEEEEEKRVETNNAWKKGNGKMCKRGEKMCKRDLLIFVPFLPLFFFKLA